MFLSVDGTVWIQLINFVIFFAILNVVFLRPVGAAIRKRRAYIDGVRKDTDDALTEARDLRAQAEAKRAAARRAALERVTASRAVAVEEADRITREQAEAATAIADQARSVVEDEVQVARSREGELASALGSSLLQRALEALSR